MPLLRQRYQLVALTGPFLLRFGARSAPLAGRGSSLRANRLPHFWFGVAGMKGQSHLFCKPKRLARFRLSIPVRFYAACPPRWRVGCFVLLFLLRRCL